MGEGTAHLVHGYLVGLAAFGCDEVGNGFGLRQVHFPVHESTHREFTGCSHSTTTLQQGFQDHLLDVGRTVTSDLGRVFPRKTFAVFEYRDHHFVQHFSGCVAKTCEVSGVRWN